MTTKPYLKKSVRLHREASQLANKARIAQFDGDETVYSSLIEQAFQKESESAILLREDPSHHMFAILHRSAATLAYRCADFRAAELLIAHGLAGDPNQHVKEELYDLLGKVRLSSKLTTTDLLDNDSDLVLTLQGVEPDAGLLDYKLLPRLVTKCAVLLRNTIGFVYDFGFQELSQVDKKYRLLTSTPAKGSYKVGIKLAHQAQLPLPNFGGFDEVLSKLIENVRLLADGDIEQLQRNFNDNSYFNNFLGLAKEVAPDGERVTAVAMEAAIQGQKQSVLLDRARSELSAMYLPPANEATPTEYRISDEQETVVGLLQYADATRAHGEVKLRDDDGKWWQIVVPEGLAEDVVKPYFGDRVQVKGRHMIRARKAKRLFLVDICAAADSSRPQLQPTVSLLET